MQPVAAGHRPSDHAGGTTRNVLDLRFLYEPGVLGARVHVTNHGPRLALCARVHIEGHLSVRVDTRMFAAWEHTMRLYTWLPSGRTRTLRLASLDLTGFPYAQWEMYAAAPDRRIVSVRALHASVIGGLPDTQAPPIVLHLDVLEWESRRPLTATRRIVLEPFGCYLDGQ